MKKTILSMLVATLVCVAGSAKAVDGIPASTLGQMGLSGLTVISDRDALAIRGLGFPGLCTDCGIPRVAPSATAMGNSIAAISAVGCPDCVVTSNASTQNSYNAVGTYSASGTNYSEAGLTVTKAEIVDGVGALLTTTSTKIWAGGNSSAKAF